ncbi:3-hydroxybutyryl-CoA dehydrogenase [Bacillus sp. ISL-75]|uniref:3-hydroxyacyl-CoA dehydrogenase family protein n=1 Tax=Bacillus sp. ISL-75 TaxID=2819137 RepID=UPI001BEADB58|nr:3-hydroxyacyl-CoA dehydrogenase family protein [Bacillus sp. ISL-75]MBT2729001.1 3-hydroxybutyryl-CoA dehydrogenase [Bacillus sp. ISL-75]
MTPKGIVVIGENLLAKELVHSFRAHGFNNVALNDYQAVKDIDAVIETSNLDLEQKRQNLKAIEAHVPSQTLIVSTTLALTATEAASWLSHPERLIGFGAFSNFKEGELIEVAPALQSDPSFLQTVEALFLAIGQETEVVQDEAGLVYPRILSMIINEAAFSLMEGTASVEDIDEAMKKGTNYPLGPLEWAEKIGIDDVYAVLTGLYRQLGEEKYRPAPLIRKLVHAGWTGGESEKGFYYYQNRQVKEYSI